MLRESWVKWLFPLIMRDPYKKSGPSPATAFVPKKENQALPDTQETVRQKDNNLLKMRSSTSFDPRIILVFLGPAIGTHKNTYFTLLAADVLAERMND